MPSIGRVRAYSLSRHQARPGQRPLGAAQPRRHRLAQDGRPVLLRGQQHHPEGRGPVHTRQRRQGASQGPGQEIHTG